MQLKEYQQKSIDWLRRYFQLTVQLGDADTAYYQITREIYGQRVAYRQAPGLLDMPYICLRIPTGGGKTLVAAHAVGIAARDLLHSDTPLVLWLVPTDTIRKQTLAALKTLTHPYRRAVEQAVNGGVNILDVSESLRVNRANLDGRTTIIISTIQAFRVDDTEGRKVYETSGYLMDHMENLSPDLVSGLERWENGKPIPSLANVLKLRRPIVIVDEAHNVRTSLSFETLSRFDPSVIIEFTATPDTQQQPSNVLYSVSAAELKAEEMIKMPILLETRPQWKELLTAAIAQLDELQRAANSAQPDSGEYIRPIMLIQAENRSIVRETITVDVVKETLLQDFGIPAAQIALSAYEDDELAGIDLSSPTCPVRFIITVSKLREGWDCPFAYVLCSVAEVRSATVVEQILGRIMRLPYVRRKGDARLNQAYAFVASNNFAETANSLIDGLVQNGFNRFDAQEMIRVRQPQQGELGPLFDSPTDIFTRTVPVPELSEAQLAALPSGVAAQIEIKADGATHFTGPMSEAARDALHAVYNTEADQQAVLQAFTQSNTPVAILQVDSSARSRPFSVPLLAYRQGDLLEPFEATHFIDHPWQLQSRDPSLSEDLFPSQQEAGQQISIDVAKDNQITYRFLDRVHQQMGLLTDNQGWHETDLVLWLDRQIPHPDIPLRDAQAFITRVLRRLQSERGVSLQRLIHDKYRLRPAIAQRIDQHRRAVQEEGYQQMLLDDSPLEVTPDLIFTFDPHAYPINRRYQGSYEFHKHYYPEVGHFDTQEEFECAQMLDALAQMDVWVRNPARSAKAFWLQTATAKFYPDFVCRLRDGRYLVVEYKGEIYRTNDDSEEKNTIGELWERRSGGSCLFLMVSGRNYEAIRNKVSNPTW